MNDQANALRGLMERRTTTATLPVEEPRQPTAHRPPPKGAYVFAVTSGKGGVGKSNLALNLAIALAKSRQSVLLLDANWGLGHLDLLCGLNGYWNQSHVLSGARRLEDVLLAGPGGLRVLPGLGSLCAQTETADLLDDVFQQLAELSALHDFVILDLGTGLHQVARRFLATADRLMVVTTPEPTSIADTYATIKSLAPGDHPPIEVLVNQTESASEAGQILERLKQTTRLFLQRELESAGHVPHDSLVAKAVSRRKPFLIQSPHGPASQAMKQLARRLINLRQAEQAVGCRL